MRLIVSDMLTCFSQIKQEGSYFALFVISLFVLYFLNREKHRYHILYAVLGLFLLFMNPITVWVLGRIFPVLQEYGQFVMFLPVFLYIPFAAVLLLERVSDFWKRWVLLLLLAVLIGLSGDFYGDYDRNSEQQAALDKEQQQIYESIGEKENVLILADETVAPFLRTKENAVRLLYGKDLWTPNMDMGIADSYSEELMSLYEAMKNPQETMEDIVQTAYLYDCGILIIKIYEDYPQTAGMYKLFFKTDHYLLYEMQT